MQRGTRESSPCSNRGTCDTKSGVCQCFTGYITGDGNTNAGLRGDCGFAEDPIATCPLVNGVECGGHGVCSGYPAYKCSCHAGYMGGDCSLRTCPKGLSWFGLPTAADTAHNTYEECSNKGMCDRESGLCQCQTMFTGEACERSECGASHGAFFPEHPCVPHACATQLLRCAMISFLSRCAAVCPGETPCSGHGLCTTMAALATMKHTNGDLDPTTYGSIPNKKETWDFNRMYGCYCDATWAGYDCSKRTCKLFPQPAVTSATEGGIHF